MESITDKRVLALLAEAYNEASRSVDPSTQTGALLVSNSGRVFARSYNRPLRGADIQRFISDNDYRRANVVHAEHGVVLDAARLGKATSPSILVAPWAACTACVAAIIESGVHQLIRHQAAHDFHALATRGDGNRDWAGDIAEADKQLSAAGVEIVTIQEPVPGAPPIRLSGRMFDPGKPAKQQKPAE